MHYPTGLALALLLAMLSISEARAGKVAVSGCGDGHYDPVPALMPLKSGPLALAKIFCLKIPASNFPVSPPQPSPDHNSVFVFDSIQGLSITGTGTAAGSQQFDGRITAVLPFMGNVPFAWSNDSRSVLGVRQETVKPSGFALGSLRPIRFHINGTNEKLAELSSSAGPLDEIYWIGHTGLAIAAFGTKGAYYRPEHPDLKPTIAFVDARAGKVIQSIAIADVPGLAVKSRINGVASSLDVRGNAYALITMAPNQWLLWNQGRLPRLVSIGVKPRWTPYALSPGGKTVLVMRNLSATGVICELNPRCPAPTPQSGAIAELHELPSGRLLWTLNGTANTFARSDVPSVSPNNRFALISMPTGTVALLSMTNGAVLQELPKPWTSECAMGFSADGKTVWISGGSRIVFYKLIA
ncbi:hypothetical protein [Mesorhizobium caraganae]|uniref:hypothetical protein n=1 Tax=Mesorhizobium caraganae TaxID=483206 RepID=UPI003ED0727B